MIKDAVGPSKLTECQQKAYDLAVKERRSVLLVGASTGKTHVAKIIIDELQTKHKQVVHWYPEAMLPDFLPREPDVMYISEGVMDCDLSLLSTYTKHKQVIMVAQKTAHTFSAFREAGMEIVVFSKQNQ